MSKENIQSEIESKYKKLPENPETLKESLKLFPSQKDVKEKYLENIEKGIFYFSSISGYWGSGKTFIAKNIGEEIKNKYEKQKTEKNIFEKITDKIKNAFINIFLFLFCINKNEVKDKYITFHYVLWQTDLELMHKHFLTELAVSAGKKNDKQIELSIHYSRLLQKEIIFPFFFIILALIFQVFNMSSPLFSYIYSFIGEQIKEIIEVFISLYPSFNIFKYTKVNVNENTVFSIIRISISVLLSLEATRFICKRTGGTLYGITSVLGIGMGDVKCSLNHTNLYDIFCEIIKNKNIFIIIDNLDRVSKENIYNTLAFLDNIKTIVERYNDEKK